MADDTHDPDTSNLERPTTITPVPTDTRRSAAAAPGSGLSRRDLLKRAGAAGAAATVPVAVLAPRGAAQTAAQTTVPREPLETLTPGEADTLEAIAARLVPTDAAGPGAREARAAHYIDRALGGFLAPSREAYRGGLAAVDAYARTSRGASFAQLPPADQDAVLTAMEANTATGFAGGSAAFFNLVLAHTLQGTFGDPHYGGNRNFVGWDLVAYPGVRLAVTRDEQRLGGSPRRLRMSAYDYGMFAARKPGRADGRPPGADRRARRDGAVAPASAGTTDAKGHDGHGE